MRTRWNDCRDARAGVIHLALLLSALVVLAVLPILPLRRGNLPTAAGRSCGF